MTRHAAYALLFLIVVLSSMAILQEMDDRTQTAIWSPK